jgi:hypothetical protein
MTQTRVDYELPFKGVNVEGLRVGVANQIESVAADDINILHGRGHPDAISDAHVVGLIFNVDPANVTQADVDNVTAEIETLLGTAIYLRGWGSHDPDYLGDYGAETSP